MWKRSAIFIEVPLFKKKKNKKSEKSNKKKYKQLLNRLSPEKHGAVGLKAAGLNLDQVDGDFGSLSSSRTVTGGEVR